MLLCEAYDGFAQGARRDKEAGEATLRYCICIDIILQYVALSIFHGYIAGHARETLGWKLARDWIGSWCKCAKNLWMECGGETRGVVPEEDNRYKKKDNRYNY
jgi:hypothetical protein